MGDIVTLVCLAIWAFLFGLPIISNVKMENSTVVMGWAAFVLGLVCLIRAIAYGVTRWRKPPAA